jgi:hypothetical protein
MVTPQEKVKFKMQISQHEKMLTLVNSERNITLKGLREKLLEDLDL